MIKPKIQVTREELMKTVDLYVGSILNKYHEHAYFGASMAIVHFVYDHLNKYEERVQAQTGEKITPTQKVELESDKRACEDSHETAVKFWKEITGRDLETMKVD